MTLTTHPELHDLRNQLREIYNAMATFGSAQLSARPPILDSSIDLSRGDGSEEFHSHQDAVHGLRALREAVKRDLDVLEKFLDDPNCASAPALSTNAPYLISVWNEVLHAPHPIVTIMRTFLEGEQPAHVPRRGSRKPPGVKVDVVADGGRRWIRVNTTKNSRLLAEFREIDSYMTESEDEDDDGTGRPSLAPKEFDNSILRVGRSLLEAARQNPLPGTTTPPSVTLRLTRLDPSPANPKEHDPRVAQTIDILRDMGIDVQLGERDPSQLPKVSPAPVRRLEPSIRVNLDLSILIALVSDITHSPLPVTPAEADARYVPSAQYREWKRKREGNKRSEEEIDGDNGIGKHSRALANQALQEMGRGLLYELRDRLASVSSPDLENVEFWTTPEARDRCLRIVLSKIGGPHEKRRAAALFPAPDASLSEAVDKYWDESRYPRAFLPIIPIHVFPSSVPPPELEPPATSGDGRELSPFFRVLARTCHDILAQETIPAQVPSRNPTPPADDGAEENSEEIERAAVTKVNPRLTAHTVQSMLWGAVRGWTTLTANKSSVKAILRDIRTSESGYGAVPDPPSEAATVAINGREGDGDSAVVVEKAALWVVDPRSLAEGMRSDYSE
ncbi:hypothetical protein L226DRAFT_461538 [Lentinus tigrinus ALCF2SS1-7]|uniref:DUF1308 domain-containing protein n=1 Tax=Lentinus tigrinus ALCF2SS1-6 TaxID=1328759 RepID=A0A5C2SDA2_9APHY|nr:hypothetical protein L227DRAFT_545878 [Lentinus tigrinus ALCF2SS1-6]RPD76050.1 hypothetical protein L226DRAFT_461538 [Lentinus tigrinus ALCF2SS1-7]